MTKASVYPQLKEKVHLNLEKRLRQLTCKGVVASYYSFGTEIDTLPVL